ncbi:hypothetical protein PENANT_c005G07754 [Penicillium antarcticum]|uniref:Transcription factor TFIIIC triple barrel domain-containing protein n=1 Tax=Penicillium antarcticum TaxID=416450 RepID=A0A1V6QEV6_9EURO|nr:uncharacterized protein N7508_007630 [Penicillium antarcticum]KAJ5297381.1 hypothetical protein N7508_007630 [Penicillium antarcticum]OQD87552.1 hypothetical protein PENANT_c005G07754 [Penicillium antarcticum]
MDSDSEYEYEYGTETESFYLNLDLTSHHGALRPPRRRDKSSAANTDDNGFSNQEAFTPIDTTERGVLPDERIQILGLHTCNPVVSYYNQIFSCSWADQIGTELVFANPDTDPDMDSHPTEPLHRGPSYELIAANSAKIIGRKATLITSSKGTDPNLNLATSAEASSQGPASQGVPRRAAPTHQTHFIQRLQEIKSAKGESDPVRTVMSQKRNVNIGDRVSGWARTEAQMAEIDRLNQRALQGDPEAQATLEQLIQELNASESSESDGSGDESSAS